MHLDAEYAKTTMFGERIAHWMHSASYAKRRVTLKTTVTNQKGELIIDGKGVVAVMRPKP